MKNLRVFVAFSLVLTAALARVAEARADEIVIATRTGHYVFNVEMAATEEARRRGLMYRRSLPANSGMLFDFGESMDVAFWMKNTYIPLDMLFVRADGSIARIAENTRPRSLKRISSGEPVRAVVELSAGASARINAVAGDIVRHPIFVRKR